MHRLGPPPIPDWISAQLPRDVVRYRLDLGDVAMHVMELGEGRPVVMLHGNPTWGFLYRKVMSQLAGHDVRMIVPDLVGLGLSDRVQAVDHTLENHIRWMATLLDALDVQDAVFVGQDWGGPIGLGAFQRLEGRAAGLVLLNTVIGPPKQGFRPTGFHRFARTPGLADVAFRGLGFPQRGLWLAQGGRGRMSRQVRHAYRWPLRGLSKNEAPLALARMVPDTLRHPSMASLEELGAWVARFRGPAAIVWGDRDPILGRVRSHVERTLPHAWVTRTDAGHFLQEQVPDEIAAGVLRVVDALDA